MAKTTITAIGAEAINDEAILILFGPSATEELAKYSIMQTMPTETIELTIGSQICFGNQKYRVEKMGPLVNTTLNTIGHVSLFFEADHLSQNGIYLTPNKLPIISTGMEIEFQ